MYDENKEREQEMQNRNMEDHPAQATPNFTMRDPEIQPQTRTSQQTSQQSQTGYQQSHSGQQDGCTGTFPDESSADGGTASGTDAHQGQSQMHHQPADQQYSSQPYGNGQNQAFAGKTYNRNRKPRKKEKTFKNDEKSGRDHSGTCPLFGTVSGGTMAEIQQNPCILFEETTVPAGQSGRNHAGHSSTAAGSESGDSENSVSYATSMDVSAIVEKAMPSVVAITNSSLIPEQQLVWP